MYLQLDGSPLHDVWMHSKPAASQVLCPLAGQHRPLRFWFAPETRFAARFCEISVKEASFTCSTRVRSDLGMASVLLACRHLNYAVQNLPKDVRKPWEN